MYLTRWLYLPYNLLYAGVLHIGSTIYIGSYDNAAASCQSFDDLADATEGVSYIKASLRRNDNGNTFSTSYATYTNRDLAHDQKI